MRGVAVVPGERELRLIQQPVPTLPSPSDVKLGVMALVNSTRGRQAWRPA